MIRLWLTLRRLRQRATPRSDERGAMEAYLRKNGAFSEEQMVWSHGRSFAIALVVVLIVSVSVSSYAYASDAVLPDTVLYPVRQALEVVQTKLAVTPAQKEKVQEKIVERRVKEVKKLEELKRPVPVKLKKLVEERVATTTQAVRMIKRQEKIQAVRKKEEKKESQAVQKNVIERLQERLRVRETERTNANEQKKEKRRIREERQEQAQRVLEQKREKQKQKREEQRETR
jgi:hypothetical protein